MYREYWKEINKKVILLDKLKVLCCDFVFEKGQEITIYVETSKNRMLIMTNGLHKVKKSSLNRCLNYKLNEIIES